MTDAAPSLPFRVPLERLSPDVIQGIIESFVLQEGTEYGAAEVPLERKVAQVRGQLERGEAIIVFNPSDESCQIIRREQWKE